MVREDGGEPEEGEKIDAVDNHVVNVAQVVRLQRLRRVNEKREHSKEGDKSKDERFQTRRHLGRNRRRRWR